MGKRFKKRFRSLCCFGKTSSESDVEDEVVEERPTTKEVKPVKPRKVSEEEALLQKLDEMYQFLSKSISNLYAMLEDQKRLNEEIISRHFVREDTAEAASRPIPADIKGFDKQGQRVSSKIIMGCKQMGRYKKASSFQKESNIYLGKDTCTTLEKDHPRESDVIHFNHGNHLQASDPAEICSDCQQKDITSKNVTEENLYLDGSKQKQHDVSRNRIELPQAGSIESLARNERSKTLPRYLSFNSENSNQQNKTSCSDFGFTDAALQLRASLNASNDSISNGSATLADSTLEIKPLSEEPVKSMELLSSRTRSVLHYLRDKVHSEDAMEKDSVSNVKKDVDQDVPEDRHVTKTQTCQLSSADSVGKIQPEFFVQGKSADFVPFFGVHYNIMGCKEVSERSRNNRLSTFSKWSDDRLKSVNDIASMYSQITAERLKTMAISNAISLYNGSEFVTKHRANPIAMVNNPKNMHCCISSLFVFCKDALLPRFVALYEVKPPWHRPWNSSYSATLARIDTTTKIETPNMSETPVTTWKVAPKKIYMYQLLTTTLDITLFSVKQVGGTLFSSPLNATNILDKHSVESASNILSGITEKAVHQSEAAIAASVKNEITKDNGCIASYFAGSNITGVLQHGNGMVILSMPSLRMICMEMFFYSAKHNEYDKKYHKVSIKLTQLGLLYRSLASKNVQLGRHKAKANAAIIIPLKELCGQLFVVNTIAILAEEDGNNNDARDRNISFEDDVKACDHLVATADVLARTECGCVPLPNISMTVTLRDLMDSTRISYKFTEVHAQFLCINLLRCLKDLHSQDKIHGTISPRNVMFDPTGYPYLTGCENSLASEFDSPEVKQTSLIEYLTPEYITSGQKTDATDVFQIGVMVYHLLCGRLPHQGATDQELRENLLNENFTPEFKSCTLTKDGRYFIRKCLRKDPSSRFKLKNCKKQFEKAVRWFQMFDSEELANQAFPSPFKDLIVQKTTIE